MTTESDLDAARERFERLGLAAFSLTDPAVGIGVAISSNDDPNSLVDLITIRAQGDLWSVSTSAVNEFSEIASFGSLQAAVEWTYSVFEPKQTTSISADKAVETLTNANLAARCWERYSIPQISGGAPWRLKQDTWLSDNSFHIRKMLSGWLGIATVGLQVDYVKSGHLSDVIAGICSYFEKKRIQATEQGILVLTR